MAYDVSKNGVNLSQSLGESGWTRLKNIGRFDLVKLIVTNGADVRPALRGSYRTRR